MERIDHKWGTYFHNPSLNELHADLAPNYWDLFEESRWENIRTHYIYKLFDPRDYWTFYVGQSTDMVSRMSAHRNGRSGSIELSAHIGFMLDDGCNPEYGLLGEILAPQRYADKLEFMCILHVGWTQPQVPILNKKYQWFIGKVVYEVSDFKLLYDCCLHCIPFSVYQKMSHAAINYRRVERRL
jgi:hypothetical protein